MREKLQRIVAAASDERNPQDSIAMALQAVRKHLAMDVGYISEFVGDELVFRTVDAPGLESMIKVGGTQALDDVYCRHILEGRLPEIIPDTAEIELAGSIPITQAVPIGSHVSVPILRPDGSTYGMFCCFSFEPNPSLNARDLEITKAFADIAAHQIGKDLEAQRLMTDKRNNVVELLDSKNYSVVYQPIWAFCDVRPTAFECLARFHSAPARAPDVWLAEAADAGYGVELELALLAEALSAFPLLDDDIKLSINASPKLLADARFGNLFDGVPMSRVVLEITEHAPVEDYGLLMPLIDALRNRGALLAVDDAGAGYSTFRHIIQLKPDIIKLDMSLTRDIDKDPARRALASALIFFCRETGARIVAEGIETQEELTTLQSLGISHGQGYLLGRPQPLGVALDLLGTSPNWRRTRR